MWNNGQSQKKKSNLGAADSKRQLQMDVNFEVPLMMTHTASNNAFLNQLLGQARTKSDNESVDKISEQRVGESGRGKRGTS